MLRRSFLRLIGGSAFGVLSGTSIAQSHVGLAHKAASGISAASTGSLFQQGMDVSPIRPAFAGPVCAKGRVTPEFEDFFDGTGTLLYPLEGSGDGSVEFDARKVEGAQSSKLIAGTRISSHRFKLNFSPAINVEHKTIQLRFYLPEEHNISSVSLRIVSGIGTKSYRLWARSTNSPRSGWIEYTVTSSCPVSPLGIADLSNITEARIEFSRFNTDEAAYILVNGLRVWDGRLKMPLYCCTFDDNYIRQYEAAKYALSKAIPISLFINKNWSDGLGVGSIHGMTVAQNQELASLGCVHINHGVSHSPPAPITEDHKEIMAFTSAAGGSKTQLTVPGHNCIDGDHILIMGTENYNRVSIAVESVTPDTFIIPLGYIAENPSGIIARRTDTRDLWSNPETPIEGLIADIEENRQWMIENGLGFGSHIFGSPQEWWLDHHEQHLRPYIFGRPRQGRGMGSYGLLTMWAEQTEVRSACDTHLANAYKMLQANVGTLLWTPGTYSQGTLREWTDGGIYEVTNAAGTSDSPPHSDWTYLRQRSVEDEGDRAIQIDVWHQGPDGWYPTEGTLQEFKDYMDVVAAHIAAGHLRAVDLRDLYENYLYTTAPPDTLPGDIDGDGKVDLKDFSIMAENWLKEKNGN